MAEFEVGDIVNVKGTVTAVDQFHRVHVKITGICTAVLLLMPGQREVTLVERPVKFKVGKKYRFPMGDNQYMYLGDGKWYSYNEDKAISGSQLDTHYLKLM